MCCSEGKKQICIRSTPMNCGCCQYTPETTLLDQIWPDYAGIDPNPYYYHPGRVTRIIYRNGYVNNRSVSYGPPIEE